MPANTVPAGKAPADGEANAGAMNAVEASAAQLKAVVPRIRKRILIQLPYCGAGSGRHGKLAVLSRVSRKSTGKFAQPI